MSSNNTNNIPLVEWTALQTFYQSTNGPYWYHSKSNLYTNVSLTNTTNWNFTHYPTNNPCFDQWNGIVCTCHHYEHAHYYSNYYSVSYNPTSNGYTQCNVDKIVLMGYNLTGTITSKIGTFKNLTVLNLYKNNLHGTLPKELSDLQRLEKMGFAMNSLTGSIPSSLGNLKTLTSLHINSNFLTGTIPQSLGNLYHLENLICNNNSLTGTIPSSIGNMNLTALGLYLNHLSGTLPSSLGNLINLKDNLDLHSNLLTGTIPPSIGNLKNLLAIGFFFNYLTGSIPSTFVQMVNIFSINLSGNFLTGTIPSYIGSLDELIYLYLYSNSFVGTIPSSLGYLTKLIYFPLYGNYLSGSIPSSFGRLEKLRVLLLNSNLLTGSITNIFNSSLQTALQTIQLDKNQLIGSIPSEIFNLQNLSTFAAVSNCFVGAIPYSTICKSKSLVSLILDGLHTATSCRKEVFPHSSLFASPYTIDSNLLNKLDPCIFTLPTLSTLHLSGNGITGSLPSYVNISKSLTDLTLSHNLLTGTLPMFVQENKWTNLDLSFNKITGTLSSSFITQLPDTRIALNQNRLSGNMPNSLLNVQNISVLAGNIFGCNLMKTNIAQYDSDFLNYNCGSNIFDIPYYAWVGIVICVVISFLTTGLFYSKDSVEPSQLNSFYLHCKEIIETIVNFSGRKVLIYKDNIALVIDKVGAVGAILCYLTLYIITVLLTIYIVTSIFYGIYSNQYGWIVSVAFSSGNVAFGLIFSALFVLIWLLLLLFLKNDVLFRKTDDFNISTRSISMFDEECKYSIESNTAESHSSNLTDQCSKFIIDSLKWTINPIVNVTVVVLVNVIYVIVFIHLSSNEVLISQILLATFKSFWNGIGYRVMSRIVNRFFNVNYLTLHHSSLQLSIRLLNNIVIPCVVVAIIDSECFYDLFLSVPPVQATFQYHLCNLLSTDTGVCTNSGLLTQTTNFDPPFVYSYQCSSRFITYYAPAFVFLCMIDGFVVPLFSVALVHLYNYGKVNQNHTRWFKCLSAIIPRALKIDVIESYGKIEIDKFYPYFDSLQLFLNNFTYLGLIMTFGALFPPLAASFCITILIMNFRTLFEVDRFIKYAKEKKRIDYLELINKESDGCMNSELIIRSVWMIVIISCLFYSLFMFDTLGGNSGLSASYWILIVMPLIPLIDYIIYRLFIKVTTKSRDNKKSGKTEVNRNSDLELVVEGNLMKSSELKNPLLPNTDYD